MDNIEIINMLSDETNELFERVAAIGLIQVMLCKAIKENRIIINNFDVGTMDFLETVEYFANEILKANISLNDLRELVFNYLQELHFPAQEYKDAGELTEAIFKDILNK